MLVYTVTRLSLAALHASFADFSVLRRSRALSNLYADPVAAPESIGKPDAVVFHPKKDVTEFEQGVGEHTIL